MTAQCRDSYAVLGVARTATADESKRPCLHEGDASSPQAGRDGRTLACSTMPRVVAHTRRKALVCPLARSVHVQ